MNTKVLSSLAASLGLFFSSFAQNVGIGTTSPLQTLSVQYPSGLWSGYENNEHCISAQTGATASDYILYMGADRTNDLSYIQSVHYSTAVAPLGLNERGGNVGIGTGASGTYYAPTNTLSINGSGGMWNYNQFNFYADNGITPRGFIGHYGAGADFSVASVASGSWMRIGCNNGAIAFFPDGTLTTGNLPKVMISSAGYIGVGTQSPGYPIDVESSINGSYSDFGYLSSSGTIGYSTASSGTVPISIKSIGRIITAEVDVLSDERIKKNFTHPIPDSLLNVANAMKITKYNYIDSIQKGTKVKTGFIAQQLEEVCPTIVNKGQDIIPNVFAPAKEVSIKENRLTITTTEAHGFVKGDEILLYDKTNNPYRVSVADVKNAYTFEVDNWTRNTDAIFIFGKKIDDFCTVDFDQITAIAIGAIQALNKKVLRLEQQNEESELRNNKLMKELNEIKYSKVDVSELDQLKAQVQLLSSVILATSKKDRQ